MEILNVIEIKFGIVSNITSYVMDTIREIPYEESKKIMVDKAEKFYISCAILHGCEDSEETIIEDGSWNSNGGYEVILSWTNTIEKNEI